LTNLMCTLLKRGVRRRWKTRKKAGKIHAGILLDPTRAWGPRKQEERALTR